MRRFTNDYNQDGKATRMRVRAESGHRCIRCSHPFESGKHGKGEWSPCDERCSHGMPARCLSHPFGALGSGTTTGELIREAREQGYERTIEAQWRILTVHHFDGDKSNDAWWNTLSLCQRCHLTIQSKVDPEVPWFLEHSPWIRVFVAGFYAKKYERRDITRGEAMERMDELLAYELRAK